jgi:hypothetical protein
MGTDTQTVVPLAGFELVSKSYQTKFSFPSRQASWHYTRYRSYFLCQFMKYFVLQQNSHNRDRWIRLHMPQLGSEARTVFRTHKALKSALSCAMGSCSMCHTVFFPSSVWWRPTEQGSRSRHVGGPCLLVHCVYQREYFILEWKHGQLTLVPRAWGGKSVAGWGVLAGTSRPDGQPEATLEVRILIWLRIALDMSRRDLRERKMWSNCTCFAVN